MTTSLRRIANLGLSSVLGMVPVVGSVSYWGVSGSLAAGRNRRNPCEARGGDEAQRTQPQLVARFLPPRIGP